LTRGVRTNLTNSIKPIALGFALVLTCSCSRKRVDTRSTASPRPAASQSSEDTTGVELVGIAPPQMDSARLQEVVVTSGPRATRRPGQGRPITRVESAHGPKGASVRGPKLSSAPAIQSDSMLIADQLARLRSAHIALTAPETLFVGKPGAVAVTIDPRSASQNVRAAPGVRPDTTHVSSRTEVCLAASGFKVEDEGGAENNCRTQIVAFDRASSWHWSVTALSEKIKESGPRQIDVTVNALLDTLPKYTVYTSHHKAYVRVEDPGTLHRLVASLDEWKALLLSVAAIAGVIASAVKWLASRRSAS
jgi:hypothetical protein